MDGQTLANIGQTLGIVGASALTGVLGYAKAGGFGKDRQAQSRAKTEPRQVCPQHSGIIEKIDMMHSDIKELSQALKDYQMQMMGYIVNQAAKIGKVQGQTSKIYTVDDTDAIPIPVGARQ
jgi:hypothetical protein